MASDHGYQVTPPPQRVSARPDDAGSVPVDLQMPSSIWWTVGQWSFIAAEVLGLLSLWIGMSVLQPDYISVLWTHPSGLRMLITGMALLILNFVGFLGLCLVFNHWMPATDESKRGRRAVAHGVLIAILLLLFYLPFVFIITVGPAAIQIQENLTNGL
jgi:hypothetical protein